MLVYASAKPWRARSDARVRDRVPLEECARFPHPASFLGPFLCLHLFLQLLVDVVRDELPVRLGFLGDSPQLDAVVRERANLIRQLKPGLAPCHARDAIFEHLERIGVHVVPRNVHEDKVHERDTERVDQHH